MAPLPFYLVLFAGIQQPLGQVEELVWVIIRAGELFQPLPASALGRAGPTPLQGGTIEPTLVERV